MKWDNWNSPIKLAAQDINIGKDEQVQVQYDAETLKAIASKCLQYDRNQYDNGYQQGRADAIAEAETKVKEYASVWMFYNEGMTKHEIAEQALKCTKAAVINVLEQMKEQKNDK